jgi:UDPglucose 6-dehydrogenase
MLITVIGLGYLGTCQAVALANFGHKVIGVDPDPAKILMLEAGIAPFYEPMLQESLVQALDSGNIVFSTHHTSESSWAVAHFICVGTPQLDSGHSSDLSQILSAIKDLENFLEPRALIIGRSTVPSGTASKLKAQLENDLNFEPRIVWSPEFLREGNALKDLTEPDRIIVGGSNEKEIDDAIQLLDLSPSLPKPLLKCNLETAEMVKAASNAFLALKISFINGISTLTEQVGADIDLVSKGIGLDNRIGPAFLRSGLGFGGGCLPKDLRSLVFESETAGSISFSNLLKAADEINLQALDRALKLIESTQALENMRSPLGMLGATFKPGTDDLRESPSLALLNKIQDLGIDVVVFDPTAARLRMKHETIKFVPLSELIQTCSVIVLATDWPEFAQIEPPIVENSSKKILDLRGVLNRGTWERAGWDFHRLGSSLGYSDTTR